MNTINDNHLVFSIWNGFVILNYFVVFNVQYFEFFSICVIVGCIRRYFQMNEIVFADFEGDGDVDAFELGDGSVALNSGRGQFTPFEPIGVNGLRFSARLRISTAANRVASLTTLHYDGINPVFAGSDLGNVLT